MFTKKLIISTLVAAAASIAAANTFALNDGFYAGVGLGWGMVDQNGITHNDMNTIATDALGTTSFSVTNNHTSNDNNGFAGRLFAGYQIDCHWSAELGWSKFSNINTKGTITGLVSTQPYTINASGDISTNAIDLVAKGTMPLPNNFSFFGKLGGAYIWENFDVKGNGTIDSVTAISARKNKDENNFWPTFGLGFGYDFAPNMAANLEWNRIQKVGSSDLNSTDLVTVGLVVSMS